MRRRIRTVLACLLVAVLACGNGLELYAGTAEHLTAGHLTTGLGNATSSAVVAHGQGRDHNHHHSSTAKVVTVASVCGDVPCSDGNGPNAPCCHVHAHCCVTMGFAPSQMSPFLSAGSNTKFAMPSEALPPGAMIDPVLRPPRRAV
jgi:hypothetical protein